MKEPRNVGLGDHGPDVLAYKMTLRQLGHLPSSERITNKFGPKMEDAVKDFQRTHGLAPTGRINRVTYEALEPAFNEFAIHLVKKFKRAHVERSFVLPIVHHEPGASFSVGHMDPVRVVLHDTESHDIDKSANDLLGVINFWKGHPFPGGSLAGAHYLTDKDGFIAQIGTLADILQHTGGANTGSVGIEQIGFASFKMLMWLARPAQLDATAKCLAYLNVRHQIPLVVSTSHGVSTHAMQSKIHPESLGHTDPGVGYPLGRVRKKALAYVAAGGWVDNH